MRRKSIRAKYSPMEAAAKKVIPLGDDPDNPEGWLLVGYSDLEIEERSGWTGKPGKYIAGLIASGFLEGRKGRRRLLTHGFVSVHREGAVQ